MIATILVVIEIITSTIMTIDSVPCIFVSLLFKSLGSSNRTFGFNDCIDSSPYGIMMGEGCEEFWLRPLSQDLFSLWEARRIILLSPSVSSPLIKLTAPPCINQSWKSGVRGLGRHA